MRWNDISVSRKLAISMIGLLMAMAGVATATLLYSSRAMESAMSAVRDHDQRIVNAVRWLGVAELSTERMVASVSTNDGDLVMQYEKAVTEGLQRMDAIHKEIAARPISAQSATTLHKLSAQQTELLALLAKASAMSNSGDVGGLRTLVAQTFHPAIATYLQLLRDFATLQEAERDAAVAQAQALRQTIGLIAVASAVFLLLVASGIVVAITRSIAHPLQYAVQVAEDIARGRLAQAVVSDRRDEFGRLLQALERMATQLHRVVAEVRSGIDSVSLASAEIASGNLDLSQRTEQTASSLQQTAASVEDLTSTVSQSADTAQQANQMATRAVDLATQGGEVMHRAVDSMERIAQSSRKIADIIGVIDGISFQTNILALNAAVEAARAGEQGRGFAVVAAEVRQLAQRSAVAAKEIGTLIQTSADAVKDGVQQVNDTGGAMLRIVEGVKGVSSYLGEITSAANAQRNGLGQINSAVANLDQMTQQNAALVEEAAAAAASLRDQAQRLTEVVSIFDLGMDPTLPLKRPLALGV